MLAVFFPSPNIIDGFRKKKNLAFGISLKYWQIELCLVSVPLDPLNINSVEQALSWPVNSKYSCFNEIGDCLPYSLTKAYREIEMQVHAFLIAAIVVCEWLISHSRISNCGGGVNGIEINSSPVLVMNTTDPNLISPRIRGRSHKLFYHTRVMYSSH